MPSRTHQLIEASEPVKAMLDIASVSAVIGWLFGMLPAFATLLTIIWTGLRIYESILNIREKRAASRPIAPPP